MIDIDDIDQIVADPKATTDELRSVIVDLLPCYMRHLRKMKVDNKRVARRNDRMRVTAMQHKQIWTRADDERVQSSSLTDAELARIIGRTMNAIKVRRLRLKKLTTSYPASLHEPRKPT